MTEFIDGRTVSGDSGDASKAVSDDLEDITRFARDGGWCWYQDPRAVIRDGKLVFGTVTGRGDRSGDVRASVFDLATGADRGTFVLHPKFESDDHCTPAFYVRPDGRILAVYASHTSPAHYYRLSAPDDPTRWEPERAFAHPHGVTYMNLYHLAADDALYNFYRDTDGTYCPAFLVSGDHGTTWQPGGKLIFHGLADRHRPYPRYWSDGQSVHVAFTEANPHEYPAGCSIYYARFQAGRFSRADGTRIKDVGDDGPLLPREAETVFSGGPTRNAWTSSIVTDDGGRVYVAYSVNHSAADHRFRYAVWDDKAWTDHEVAFAGPGFYPGAFDYTGLITVDPTDPRRVYLSTNVDPEHGTCSASGVHEMYEAATMDLGRTWTFTPLTENSTEANIRPICVADDRHVAVLWMRGRYRTFTDFDTDVVGFVRRR